MGRCFDCDCDHENPEPLLSEIARTAIREGGRVAICCHVDPFDDRPTGAAIVRRLALLGARWSEVKRSESSAWVDCTPTCDEQVVVFLNAADIEALQ